ncbi:hypothetical protein MXD59_21635 [Frankia sp. Ag45/Mut15]|uniref:YD repeat protein n=1 Tax=Frankia umida TaxID=573489 RepID=A0ABT0K3H1_9ACTN|nr:hypothetical protein [Frankia umida]MCK9878341.1 hypothetical protein [Frankia umida]
MTRRPGPGRPSGRATQNAAPPRRHRSHLRDPHPRLRPRRPADDDLGRTTSDTLAGPGGTLRAQSYTYDNDDNELSTTISPAGVAGAGTSTYTYDRADRLTSWTDPASVTTSMAAGNWATLSNTHGDVIGAFTTNGVSLTDSRHYGPFGTPVAAGTSGLRVGFQGSWTDPSTSRVSAQARWYTPGTGSFASRDVADVPFTSSASANRRGRQHWAGRRRWWLTGGGRGAAEHSGNHRDPAGSAQSRGESSAAQGAGE